MDLVNKTVAFVKESQSGNENHNEIVKLRVPVMAELAGCMTAKVRNAPL